jgi:hypothetical protein
MTTPELDAIASRSPGRTITVLPPDRFSITGWFTLPELDEMTKLVATLLQLSPRDIYLAIPPRKESTP